MQSFNKCSDVNAIIDEKTSFKKGILVNPELGINTDASNLLLDFIKLGMKKALSQDTAGKVSPEKIREVLECWQQGYALLTLKKDAEKPVTVKMGKSGKLQYSQLQVASALRATLGADDSRAKLVESLRDELFVLFLEKNAGESYMVDAFSFLKKQDDLEAEKEKAKLEAELAALGL